MKEKKLMHMKRAELIEIIYQLQETEEELRAEIATLRTELDDRRMKIKSSGSIAEAAMKLSGVFEAAQQAADMYLEEVKMAAEEKSEGKLRRGKKAKTKAADAKPAETGDEDDE